MAVLGYDPHPAGGFIFHRDDGPSMHFMGPEADGLRQYIDATRPPDARLASNNPMDLGPPTASTADYIQAQHTAEQQPRTAMPAGRGGVEMPTGPAQRAPQATTPMPVVGPERGSGGDQGEKPLFTPQEIAAYALKPTYSPGRAAYNPEADAASRRPVPVQQTVSGGLPGTPEEQKQRIEDARALHDANREAITQIDAASAERTAAVEDQRTAALNNALKAEMDQRDALARREAVENTWNSTNARLQAERDAVAQQRVDPNRLFRGADGAIAAIGSSIAVGLGAFGSALTGAPNYAHQIVQASIQRDVDAQTDQIHRKGAAAQNAIADFQRNYGLTLDEARTAVKATQLRYAASMADLSASRIGSADAKMKAATLKAGFLGEAMKDEATLAEMYKGRQSTQFAMAAPQAGTRGGLSEPTAAQIKGRAEALGAVNKASGEGKPGIQAQRLQLRMDEDERTRRVALPDGSDAWATSKERADVAQQKINGGEEIKKNVARMRAILDKPGNSLDPELYAEYNALAQRNLTITKEVEGFRTLTDSDQEMMKPLTGQGGEEFGPLVKSRTLSALQAAEQHVDFRVREGTQNLYEDPDARKHLKHTEAAIGIKETGGTVRPRKKRASGADEEGGGEGGED